MPMGNVSACQGDCATETARYIQAKLTGKIIVDTNDGNGSSDNTDNGNDNGGNTDNNVTPQPEPVLKAPIAPSQLVAVKASNKATLTWQDNSNNENEFVIWRKVGTGSWRF